jgi:hypothetical protein
MAVTYNRIGGLKKNTYRVCQAPCNQQLDASKRHLGQNWPECYRNEPTHEQIKAVIGYRAGQFIEEKERNAKCGKGSNDKKQCPTPVTVKNPKCKGSVSAGDEDKNRRLFDRPKQLLGFAIRQGMV